MRNLNRKPIILFGILSILLISGCSQQQTTQTENLKIPLTLEKKQEICNDVKAYTDYCYIRGINVDDCSTQIVEKTMRIYQLAPNQVSEVLTYCEGN